MAPHWNRQAAVFGVHARLPESEIVSLTPVFAVLHIAGGQVGLPLFVATLLLSKKVQGHPTLINFSITWILYSIIYCLSIYTGRHTDSGIGAGVCFAQSALVHGATPMTITAYAFFVLQVWKGLRGDSGYSWLQQHRKSVMVVTLGLPYIVLVAFFVASLVVLIRQPEMIARTGAYYCTMNYWPFALLVPALTAVVSLIVLVIEVLIAVNLFRRWGALRRTQGVNHAMISMMIRIALFTVYGFVAVAASAGFLVETAQVWPYIMQASVPTAFFLVFGTRRNVFRAWCFWLRSDDQHTGGIGMERLESIGSREKQPDSDNNLPILPQVT